MKILEVQIFDTKSCGPTSVMKQIIPRLNVKHFVDVFSVRNYSSDKEELAKSLGSKYFHTNGEIILTEKKLEKYIPGLKDYDVIHIHGIYEINHYILAKYLRKIGVPYIVSIHGNLMRSALMKSRVKKHIAINIYIKKLLKQSSSIHVMAKNELNDVKLLIGEHDYQLIYNGVESTCGEQITKKQNDKLNILFIGRLDVNHKGLDLLIEAIAKNINKFVDKIQLFLVGPFDSKEDRKVIEAMLEATPHLRDIIRIEGPKYGTEKEKYYSTCDVFIHTSRYEGMPVAVLEAMDRGMPCIITPGTNMGEIIKECNGGIVVEPYYEDISRGIEIALDLSSESISRMGSSAKTWSKKNLSWELIAKQYIEMYLKKIK